MYVYALGDPHTQQIRYIGITKDVYRRYAQHLNHPHINGIKNTWMEHIKSSGIVPTLTVLESDVDKTLIYEREKYWIEYYLALNSPLTNIVHNPTSTKERTYSTLKEIAEKLSVSEGTVHKFIKKGDLKGNKIGREWHIEEVDLDNFILEQRRIASMAIEPILVIEEEYEEEDDMRDETDWITPREASQQLTARVGYVVTPDDLKQMKRHGKFKNIKKFTDRLDLYDAGEIAVVAAPNKHVKRPAEEWEQAMSEINERRKSNEKPT